MYATWLAPFISTVLAWARLAIIRSWIGLIDRSWEATMYQVGLLFHAGLVALWVKASVEIGTCEIAMKWDTPGGTSAAKSAAKWAWSIHQLPLLSAVKALDACGTACSIEAQLSPSSSAKAAIYTSATTFGSLPSSVMMDPP